LDNTSRLLPEMLAKNACSGMLPCFNAAELKLDAAITRINPGAQPATPPIPGPPSHPSAH
jgi:hypothetical protein